MQGIDEMEYGDTHRYDLRILSNPVNRDDRAMAFQVFPIRQLGMTFTKAFSFQKVQFPLDGTSRFCDVFVDNMV